VGKDVITRGQANSTGMPPDQKSREVNHSHCGPEIHTCALVKENFKSYIIQIGHQRNLEPQK
jgi:hypothetical protein